jgi:hypothetical protein
MSAARYELPATAAELFARLGPTATAHIRTSVARAPALPDETADVLARVFAGAGDRILRERHESDTAA